MKLFSIISAAAALRFAGAAPAQVEKRVSGVQGFDISNYQTSVNFVGAYNSGARFVVIKVRFGRLVLLSFSCL